MRVPHVSVQVVHAQGLAVCRQPTFGRIQKFPDPAPNKPETKIPQSPPPTILHQQPHQHPRTITNPFDAGTSPLGPTMHVVDSFPIPVHPVAKIAKSVHPFLQLAEVGAVPGSPHLPRITRPA